MVFSNVVFSAYCACQICCGSDASGITATGASPKQEQTIAGPRSIPLGTSVLVRFGEVKKIMRIEDRTARKWDGKRWDIYFKDHDAARRFGLRKGTVTIIKTPTQKAKPK
jgi:3D (Asp-Asp-Asp) domain-containing protein